MAFGESLKGKRAFTQYFMENNLPELAALSAAIHSDEKALDWLLKNGFPEFAVLSNAIDGEPHAIAWLDKHNAKMLSLFAAACRKDDRAILWMVQQKLDLLLHLVRIIHDVLKFQSWDASDIHKRRRS